MSAASGSPGCWRIAAPYSSRPRPVLSGPNAAVAAAHPLAASAASDVLAAGGTAADAVIAAQAVISVVMPEAAGLGGDAFFLVRTSPGSTVAINAAGRSASRADRAAGGPGGTVTVPGLVAGWDDLAARFARLPFPTLLGPAIALAARGVRARAETVRAVEAQRDRLVRGDAAAWPFFTATVGSTVLQPALAETLSTLAQRGPRVFYEGPLAEALCREVDRHGGHLAPKDFSAHRSEVGAPLTVVWNGLTVHVQPPMSQGVLLAMALKALDGLQVPPRLREHAAVEATLAAFAFRDEVARGAELLAEPLAAHLNRASGRGGPRSYLHTAGVAAADAEGLVVASLLSVFDDFGSAIYVPEGGFLLNNRAAGFTSGLNAPGPSKLPVHTLAPVLLEQGEDCLGLATPGADGQVQTLLQILHAVVESGTDLATAIHKPRWRSENGRLLIEDDHPNEADLAALGHRTVALPSGDTRFGGVVGAGWADRRPFAVADWRRETWALAR
jgi:gamma-glutamyltranspeptidase / glutathione hydrolase